MQHSWNHLSPNSLSWFEPYLSIMRRSQIVDVNGTQSKIWTFLWHSAGIHFGAPALPNLYWSHERSPKLWTSAKCKWFSHLGFRDKCFGNWKYKLSTQLQTLYSPWQERVYLVWHQKNVEKIKSAQNYLLWNWHFI